MPETKQCAKCGETKPRHQFSKDKWRSDGLASICKTCRKQRNKKTLTAGAKKRRENAQRYRKVVSQLHDARTDREPKGNRCNYSGCYYEKVYTNDPHRLGFCAKHEKNAALILGYDQTQ